MIGRKFKPGKKVELTTGVLKGERATIETNPESGSHIQKIQSGWTEVWIRYEKDSEKVGRAILKPQWIDIEHIKIVR